MHLLSLHERLKAAVKTRGFFSPQIYWLSTLTAAIFVSYLNTWLLYQWYVECNKMALGCLFRKMSFAFKAKLLPLLAPTSARRTGSWTFQSHKQLTVAFHLRFLMFDSNSPGTFNILMQKAHKNSQPHKDFMSNRVFQDSLYNLPALFLSKQVVWKKAETRNSEDHVKKQQHTAVHGHCLFTCCAAFPNAH